MPSSKSSLITLNEISKNFVEDLFSKTIELKHNFNKHLLSSGPYHSGYKGTAALLFFEPSTRTRFSFEAACSRAGFHPLILDGGIGTSLEKGESVEDTIFNIEAIRPLFFVIRCDDRVDLMQVASKLQTPVINAGWGKRGHPTQALLDGLTLFEKWNDLDKKKILFVGDIKHSRVFSSHIELAKILGYEIGFCSPKEFAPVSIAPTCQYFDKVEEALGWADAVIALRVQKERHDNENIFLIEDYREHYGLSLSKLKILRTDAWIMHPGPINYGVEIEQNVVADPRSLIFKQVENGVFLREALVRKMMNNS